MESSHRLSVDHRLQIFSTDQFSPFHVISEQKDMALLGQHIRKGTCEVWEGFRLNTKQPCVALRDAYSCISFLCSKSTCTCVFQ